VTLHQRILEIILRVLSLMYTPSAAAARTSNPNSSGTVMTGHTGSSEHTAIGFKFLQAVAAPGGAYMRRVCCLLAITEQYSQLLLQQRQPAALKASTSPWHCRCADL
jgi:hypothetical protein